MPEKSDDLIHAQRRMIACRKAGDRQNALWWMRVAAGYRNRDVADRLLFPVEDFENVWWDRPRTVYSNG